jgi:midasin (ATPase involved in ribosome maturation)
MKKLYFLVERCFQRREPVLLVGETGGGKTTVCQLLNARLKLKLHILNCHQYTETSDFIGVGSCFFFLVFLYIIRILRNRPVFVFISMYCY